jgi:hypothetical protein
LKFLLINESNFHVAGFSYGPTTRDVVGRVSRSQAASDVAAAACRWILATTAFNWILAATASSRPSRLEFQHSSLTFQPQILVAAAVGTSSWRASPAMGNGSVDDTDATATTTFFFATDSKSFVCLLSIVPFIIRANVERLAYSSISIFKRPSPSVGREFVNRVLNMGGSGEGEGGGNDATAL